MAYTSSVSLAATASIAGGVIASGSLVVAWGLGWGAGDTALVEVGAVRAASVGVGFWLSGVGNYALLLPFAALAVARTQRSTLVRMSAFAGCGYLLLGLTGSVTLALAWPDLITAFAAASPEQRDVLLQRASILNTWESILHGHAQNVLGMVWFAWLSVWARRSGRHTLALLAAGAAMSLAATSGGGILGLADTRELAAVSTAILVPIWSVWLGAQLLVERVGMVSALGFRA